MEKKKLAEELRKAKAAKPESAEVLDPAAMELEENTDLAKAVDQARSKLKEFKAMAVEIRDLVQGGYEECLAKLQQDLEKAQAAKRAANPLKQQLEGAEAHKGRMAKRLEEAKTKLQERQQAVDDANAQLALQKVSVEESETAMANAVAEVASLAAQYASERTETAVVQTTPPQAPSPGFVSITFAEEKWAERERTFAEQLAQLQALVGGATDEGASASEASPSVAGDLASVDELVQDESSWSKVVPGRRKALLRRERDVLANKLRANLGEVSAAVSPFAKKNAAAGHQSQGAG